MSDETALAPFPEDWRRGLAVVAHPDDLEYGAAPAIAGWTAGGRVITYLLATRGEAGIDATPPDIAGRSGRRGTRRGGPRRRGHGRVPRSP